MDNLMFIVYLVEEDNYVELVGAYHDNLKALHECDRLNKISAQDSNNRFYYQVGKCSIND